ncbi:MAG: hypothetical protein RDU14_00945 [Melioribacteraceae bacterium]|nr:hypothetical protein [Melioribacteraceae bacterium]
MEEVVNQAKNQKLVKILSWILIVASVLVLLKEVFLTQGYLAMFNMEQITKNFDPPIEINFTLYYIQSAIEFLLCIVVFVSATFVLKYKNFWRKVLVYGLIASIIFLFVSPLIDFYNFPTVKIKGIGGVEREFMEVPRITIFLWSFTWSIIFSIFFIYVIYKLSKPEVKLLFK